ncbi:hypothetical protein [Pontibacter pamirensis]|uniref:hypothetical protein n=1 Tax=Pontibacter pamirensis TaxID=2562824 RepID=UPI001389AD3F|nr:hypothetical protein [Pontibacter pamirensis]
MKIVKIEVVANLRVALRQGQKKETSNLLKTRKGKNRSLSLSSMLISALAL